MDPTGSDELASDRSCCPVSGSRIRISHFSTARTETPAGQVRGDDPCDLSGILVRGGSSGVGSTAACRVGWVSLTAS